MASRSAPLFALLLAAVLAGSVPLASAVEPAKAFTAFTVDGEVISTESARGRVLLLDFSGTWCEPCRLVEVALREMYANYSDEAIFLTLFTGSPRDNTSIAQWRDQEAAAGKPVPWHLASVPPAMELDYGVTNLPRVFIVNADGYVTYSFAPIIGGIDLTQQARQNLRPALVSAIGGTATPIDLVSLSIPALLVIAALLSFFSPCSFPVLPAFMAYYLRLDAKGTAEGAKPSTKVAAGRGFVASLGIVTVYLIIALIVFAIGLAAQGLVKWMPPVIGVTLIALAVLSLLPYQYHFLTRPFIALKQKIVARFGGKWEPGVGAKLFAFGAGYGAAGFACVAPPFIGAVINASALGTPEQAVFGLALYVLIVIGVMVAVVVALHLAGDRVLKKIRSWSAIMKYVSAVALIVAGSYLLYLFAVTYL